MMTWNIFVLAAAALLLVFLFWKEVNRSNKQRLLWRLLASLIAVGSLVLLAVPVSFKGKKTSSSKQEILLLTDGFSRDSLRKHQNSSLKTLVYTADQSVFQLFKSPNIHFIPDLESWQKSLPANTTVHILGFGLKEEELQSLNQQPIRFKAPELPSGIQKLNWTNQVKTGENFSVQGEFLNQTDTKTKLVLKGLNTTLDSVETGTKRSINFSFSTVPKQNGQAVFRLIALAGKDTLENEPVPFTIEPAKSLKVLMLSASPNFENRFLKNWLAENAYGVAARSTISKNKTTTDFANLNKLSLEKITPIMLQNFDVLITDASAFGNLSKPEIAAVLAQTSRQGLGLIFRSDSSNASFINKNFAVYQSDNPQKQLSLKLNDAANSRLNIQTDRPSFIRNQPGSQVLVQNGDSKILVTSRLYGSGKVLLTTLNNTFSWQLSGKEATYATFWSLLLSKAAKKTDRLKNTSYTLFADKNSMARIHLETAEPNPNLEIDEKKLPLSQDPQIPFLKAGTFWPDKNGWLPVTQNGKTIQQIYIYENTDWKPLKSIQKIILTQKYFRKFMQNGNKDTVTQKTERNPLPPIWFYLLFLIAAAYLWFETKLL